MVNIYNVYKELNVIVANLGKEHFSRVQKLLPWLLILMLVLWFNNAKSQLLRQLSCSTFNLYNKENTNNIMTKMLYFVTYKHSKFIYSRKIYTVALYRSLCTGYVWLIACLFLTSNNISLYTFFHLTSL